MGEKRHDIKRLTSCGATRTIFGLRGSAFPRCGSAERFWKPDSLLSIQKSPISWRVQDGAPFACQEVRVKTANGPVKLSIHILVVDDEPLMAQSLADALAAEGYEIDVAVNGQRALEKIKDHTYDLILSDLRMPGLDGVGLYRVQAGSDCSLETPSAGSARLFVLPQRLPCRNLHRLPRRRLPGRARRTPPRTNAGRLSVAAAVGLADNKPNQENATDNAHQDNRHDDDCPGAR